MQIPDLSGEYTKNYFDHSSQTEYNEYLKIEQKGDYIEIYSRYSSTDDEETTSLYKGKILAADQKLQVIKILTEDPQYLWRKYLWFDYKEMSFSTNRTKQIISLRTTHFEFSDRCLNKFLDLLNYVLPILTDKEMTLKLMPGTKYMGKITYRYTDEREGYRVVIYYNRVDRYAFRLETELPTVYLVEMGVFPENLHVYFDTQWMDVDLQKRIRERVVSFVESSSDFDFHYDARGSFFVYIDN